MDEEDSLDGMDDEESKNPLAFLGLQRFTINATKSLLYLYPGWRKDDLLNSNDTRYPMPKDCIPNFECVTLKVTHSNKV